MEKVRKEVFIAKETRQIEIQMDYAKALGLLKSISAKYNGKSLNARYTKFVNAEFAKVVPNVSIEFCTDYSGKRQNRFRLRHKNRYVESVNAYIDNLEKYLYPQQEPYLDDSHILNYDALCAMCDRCIHECELRILNAQRAIKEIDIIIAAFKQRKAELEMFIKSLPSQFRMYVDFDCPVYK